MKRQSANKFIGFIIRILFLAIIIVSGVLVYRRCTADKESRFELASTPLKVERIRDILQLNTVRFRDEVVVDSVEYYKDLSDAISGSLQKLTDPDQMKHAFNKQGLKRRLTLIVKGELLYGVDLKSPKFSIREDADSIHVILPEPRLLSVAVTPNQTEVYIENGIWTDAERQFLEKKAIRKMEASGDELRLKEKSKTAAELLLKRLVQAEKGITIRFVP